MVVDPISLALFGGAAAYMYDVHRRVQADQEDHHGTSAGDADSMEHEGGYSTFHDYERDDPTGQEIEDLDTDDLDQYQ